MADPEGAPRTPPPPIGDQVFLEQFLENSVKSYPDALNLTVSDPYEIPGSATAIGYRTYAYLSLKYCFSRQLSDKSFNSPNS